MVDFLVEQGIKLRRHPYWPDYYSNAPGAVESGRTVFAELFDASALGPARAASKPAAAVRAQVVIVGISGLRGADVSVSAAPGLWAVARAGRHPAEMTNSMPMRWMPATWPRDSRKQCPALQVPLERLEAAAPRKGPASGAGTRSPRLSLWHPGHRQWLAEFVASRLGALPSVSTMKLFTRCIQSCMRSGLPVSQMRAGVRRGADSGQLVHHARVKDENPAKR
jgi:hypothetical protein